MTGSGISLRDVWEAHAKAQEREDFADLQRELNGLPSSKTKSFTAGINSPARIGLEDKKKEEEKKRDEEWFVTTWLARMSESYKQAYERLNDTINTAREASLLTLEDIRKKRERAEREIEEIRERAIKLGDGRRVYFTKDGRELYDDDGGRITDEESLAEAEEKRKASQNAPGHEERSDMRKNLEELREQEDRAREYMKHADEIEELARYGKLSERELEDKRRELVENMPAEVRHQYDRLMKERKNEKEPAIASEGGGMKNESRLNREFQMAGALRSEAPISRNAQDADDDLVYVPSPGGPR